ncbi:ADP-ribose pyrophosphatase [Pedobacter sp. UYP30]|uniref:NUDIX hydrolase n=1 Tax=Pedobacter sp. UYP30 TaxID=1756400 RepID=UPI003398342F
MKEKNPWQTLSSKKKYDNNWISLTEHQVVNPSGGNGIYGVVHFKNIAIGILPIDRDRNTWLVGQFRYATNTYSWEIPEGGGPFNEQPLESAKRELLEETGLSAKNYQEILRMHLSNSVSDELCIVYLARDLIEGIAMPEETEQLQIKKLPFEEVYKMVLNGEITDSVSVAAILKAKVILG